MIYIPNTRQRGEQMSVSIAETSTLSTLAQFAGLKANGPAMTRGGKVLSVRGAISLFGLTAGDGPLAFGIMQGDMSMAELEAYFEADGPLTPSDTTGKEIASRGSRYRQLGVLVPVGNGTVASVWLDNASVKGLKFSEATETTIGWGWWIYNLGQALTTGASWSRFVQHFCEFNLAG